MHTSGRIRCWHAASCVHSSSQPKSSLCCTFFCVGCHRCQRNVRQVRDWLQDLIDMTCRRCSSVLQSVPRATGFRAAASGSGLSRHFLWSAEFSPVAQTWAWSWNVATRCHQCVCRLWLSTSQHLWTHCSTYRNWTCCAHRRQLASSGSDGVRLGRTSRQPIMPWYAHHGHPRALDGKPDVNGHLRIIVRYGPYWQLGCSDNSIKKAKEWGYRFCAETHNIHQSDVCGLQNTLHCTCQNLQRVTRNQKTIRLIWWGNKSVGMTEVLH